MFKKFVFTMAKARLIIKIRQKDCCQIKLSCTTVFKTKVLIISIPYQSTPTIDSVYIASWPLKGSSQKKYAKW